MATLLSIDKLLPPNSDFPINNIIVDTNIIIDYKDPFGYVIPTVNTKTVDQVNRLKSHYKVYSTIVSGLEYYKYLQVGYYNIYINTHAGHFERFSTFEFKKLRKTISDFSSVWDLRIKEFKRTIKKHFPPIDVHPINTYTIDNIDLFDGSNADFGDAMIYRISKKLDFSMVLTKDKDFSSFSDDLNLIIL